MPAKHIAAPPPPPWIAVLLAAALLTAGCSGPDPLRSPSAARLRGLAMIYLNYAAAKGSGPPSESVFRKYSHSLDGIALQMAGVDPKAIDDTFVSLRDNQPFVVLYGVGISQMSGKSAPLIAYEKTGANGKRLIAYANTKLECVNEARFKELTQAP
jgi:hypothetical protein